jgi:hypothetical protein
MTDAERRERTIVWLLRAIITATFALGACAIVLGYQIVPATHLRSYVDYNRDLGGDLTAASAIAILVPGVWAWWRPRWPQLIFWIMWTVPVAMLIAMLSLGAPSMLEETQGDLAWLLYATFGLIVLVISAALPIVRSRHRSPPLPAPGPRLPPARALR